MQLVNQEMLCTQVENVSSNLTYCLKKNQTNRFLNSDTSEHTSQ